MNTGKKALLSVVYLLLINIGIFLLGMLLAWIFDEIFKHEEYNITEDKNSQYDEKNLNDKSLKEHISITESYYKLNTNTIIDSNPDSIIKQTYVWKVGNLKAWSAQWKIPKKIVQEAMDDLKELEQIAMNGNITNPEQISSENRDLYNKIIDNWVTPEEFWEATFKLIKIDNDERIKVISDIFNYAINIHELDRNDAIEMIVGFVQNIKYQIPQNYLEILPPINSVGSNLGDCDTKSILLSMILDDLGYETIVLYSSHYLHAMCAVYYNGIGDYIEYKGLKYSIIETTTPGWLTGMIPSEMDDLRYWYVIDL